MRKRTKAQLPKGVGVPTCSSFKSILTLLILYGKTCLVLHEYKADSEHEQDEDEEEDESPASKGCRGADLFYFSFHV